MFYNRTYYILAAAILLASTLPMGAWGQCGPNVPAFNVDLSSSPSATWSSPFVQRQDNCCGTTPPDACVQFSVTLHPNAQGILFDICDGAVPGGSMFYQVACGPAASVGQPLCLNGPGPHNITFCKPGNNTNVYCITSVPAPYAGPDIGVNDGCLGSVSSTGFAPGTVQWTSVSPGTQGQYDGYLNCNTCDSTAVTSQPGYPAYVDYQVCGNAISPCSSVQYCDTVRVHFFSTLGGTILPQQPVICYGGTGIDLTVTGSGGTAPYSYLWSTGSTSATIHVISAGTYSVQVSDTSGCPPAMTQVTVTEFTQPITADAGNDILLCSGSTSVFLNGAVTGVTTGVWSNGNGQYSASITDLNATYTFSPGEIATGIAQLILSTTNNLGCPPDADTIMINISDPFTAINSQAQDVSCAGATDGWAQVNGSIPGTSFQWNDPGLQITPTATGLSAGTYQVVVSSSLGCDTTINAIVGEPLPLLIDNLQVVDESCAGANDGSVTANVSGGTAPYFFLWSNSQSGPMIIVGAGSYSVTVTDANGCSITSSTITVNATGQPNVANAGADIVSCASTTPIPLIGSVTNATGGTWSGGNGTFSGPWDAATYLPTQAEIIAGAVDLWLITTGNTTCLPDSDMVHITLSNSFQNAQVFTTDVHCAGDSNGTATFSPTSNGLTYQWNDQFGQVSSIASTLAAGTYQVVVTNALGCDTTMSATITEPPPLVIDQITSTMISCHNGQDGSATASVSGGTPSYTYQWSANAGGGNLPMASGLGAGVFIISIADANGCTVQDVVTLNTPPALTLSANVPDTVCVNAPVTLTAQATGGTGQHTIMWQNIGQGSPLLYSFAASQTVGVTVTDANGCTGPVLTLPLTVLDLGQATLTAYNDTIVCPGGSATIWANVTNYPGSLTYFWPQLGISGPGPFTVPVSNDQTWDVTVTDICGAMLADAIDVQVDVPPQPILPPVIAEGCEVFTVQLDAGLSDPTLSYQWDFGNGHTSIQVSPAAIYGAGTFTVNVTVTTMNGCSTSASTPGSVIVHPSPTADFTASSWSASIEDPIIDFTDLSQINIVEWNWSFGNGAESQLSDPSHNYLEPGHYSVQLWVMDGNGCVDSVTKVVDILPDHTIVIPNIFTPSNNGNGGVYDPHDLSNDVFYPFMEHVDDMRMQIFNRWGELVFETKDLAIGWDGHYRGAMSQQDAYVYQLWVRFVDGFEDVRRGDVTLLR